MNPVAAPFLVMRLKSILIQYSNHLLFTHKEPGRQLAGRCEQGKRIRHSHYLLGGSWAIIKYITINTDIITQHDMSRGRNLSAYVAGGVRTGVGAQFSVLIKISELERASTGYPNILHPKSLPGV